jgi:uncharacterized protein YcfL
MKKVFILIVSLLLLSMTACSSQGDNQTTEGSSDEKQEADNMNTAQQEQISDTEGEEMASDKKLIMKINGEEVNVSYL